MYFLKKINYFHCLENESIKSANFKLLIEALKVNQTLKELHGGGLFIDLKRFF